MIQYGKPTLLNVRRCSTANYPNRVQMKMHSPLLQCCPNMLVHSAVPGMKLYCGMSACVTQCSFSYSRFMLVPHGTSARGRDTLLRLGYQSRTKSSELLRQASWHMHIVAWTPLKQSLLHSQLRLYMLQRLTQVQMHYCVTGAAIIARTCVCFFRHSASSWAETSGKAVQPKH